MYAQSDDAAAESGVGMVFEFEFKDEFQFWFELYLVTCHDDAEKACFEAGTEPLTNPGGQ